MNQRIISIHVLREEDDFSTAASLRIGCYFYPRPPRGGRPYDEYQAAGGSLISIHVLREEDDSHAYKDYAAIIAFLSTSSARRTTPSPSPARRRMRHFYPRPPRGGRPACIFCGSVCGYFYPRPPRGGRLWLFWWQFHSQAISIHVLREEDDVYKPTASCDKIAISIHVLREEDDLVLILAGLAAGIFLSTSSARRTTQRPPPARCNIPISIHVLRKEDDGAHRFDGSRRKRFLSTSSARRTTTAYQQTAFSVSYFYPRPPQGGRPVSWHFDRFSITFLSTSSARRTTSSALKISPAPVGFLSTSSARRTTAGVARQRQRLRISIHVLRKEDDF